MNRVTSTERKKPAVKQASYVNRYCLTGDRIRTVIKLSHLIPSKVNSKLRVRSNYPIPQSGITTAVRNLCSSGARSKKAMLLDLVKDVPLSASQLHGAGNGDHKRAPSILPTGKEKGVRYSLSKSEVYYYGWRYVMEGSISINRTTSNIDEDYIRIEIIDELSRETIVSGKICLKDYAKLITGLSGVKMDYVHGDLSHIGKKHENKTHVFETPDIAYTEGRKDVAYKIAVETCPDGWEPDEYFGSRDSFFTKDGKNYARCTIRRWV